jgi:hypothetical protein
MQLGNLRDTYYEDAYGSLQPPPPDEETNGAGRPRQLHQQPRNDGRPRLDKRSQ